MEKIKEKDSVQGRIFNALSELEAIRRKEAMFSADAEVYTKDYSDSSILWIVRKTEKEELHAVFNFSDVDKTVWMPETAEYTDLLTGKRETIEKTVLPSWDFLWLKK